jgi:hypothetical protein
LFTLLQASLLKQPLVKKLLHIPTPPKIAAPPTGSNKPPTLMDTYRWAVDGVKGTYRSQREAQQAAIAAADARAQKEGRAVGQANISKEIIREKKRR